MSFKSCKYGCNSQIQWDTQLNAFRELDGRLHDRKRCEGLRPQRQQQQPPQEENPLAPVSDESVEKGIDAFNLMTSLIKEVEDVKEEIKHVREVLGNQERLFNQMLVWTQQINKRLLLQKEPEK